MIFLAFVRLQLEDLVSDLPGVTVTCEPKDLNVSLQVPLDSEGEKSYSWTVRVSYEVRLKMSLITAANQTTQLNICKISWYAILALSNSRKV